MDKRSPLVEVLAYAAGVIDSDGSIDIRRDTWALRHGIMCQATFSERVTVRQIEPQAVDLLKATFGGHRGTASNRHGQPLHHWQVVDRVAAAFLVDVLPYLRIKRRQADLCLELRRLKEESRQARFAVGRGHVGAGKRPEAISIRMEEVHQQMREANRVDGRYERALGGGRSPVTGTVASSER